MNDLQIFSNPKFGELRTFIEPDGTVLFCGADIAKMLGYSNTQDAINRHCKGVVKREGGVQTGLKADGNMAYQNRQMSFVPIGDIYRLAARSQLDGAEEFERWVFDEVIPSVHKTGSYSMQELPKTQAQLLLAQSELLVQMETKLTAVEEKADNIEKRLDSAIHIFSTSSEEMWAGDMNMQIKEIVKEHKLSEPKFKGKLYKELEQVASVRINSRLSRFRKRMLKQGSTYAQTMTVTKLDIIEQDIQLREIFQGIVRKHQAVFCVGGVEPDNTFQRQEPSDERG